MHHETPQAPAERPILDKGTVRLSRWLIVLITVGAILGLCWAILRSDWTPTTVLFQQARIALQVQDYPLAERLGRRLMTRPERLAEGLVITGESLSKQGRFAEAVHILNQIPSTSVPMFLAGKQIAAGIQADELGQFTEAEATLRDALRVDPQSLPVNDKLSFILGLAGRSWEAAPHHLILVQPQQFPLHHLSLLALGSTAAENTELIQILAKKSPEDIVVKCGLARLEQREGRLERAEQLLKEIVGRAPTLLAAQAWFGELLVNRKDELSIQEWHSQLPPGANEFPDIWFVRGLWAVNRGDPRAAARCFWECLKRDFQHQSASYQLANILTQLNDNQSAEVFRKHTRLLNDLVTAAKTIEISGSFAWGKRAAKACDALGLTWEAAAWREAVRRSEPRTSQRKPAPNETRPPVGTPRIDPRRDPTHLVNLSSYPLPIWKLSDATWLSQGRTGGNAMGHDIKFAEQAQQSGIDFIYHNASQKDTESEFMYEFSGGGIGILDYDLNGWPDFYFTQGSDKPPGETQDFYSDVLYRNLGTGRFVEVSMASKLRETGFSQGCAVGDFDNDGFPDLFVGNIGPNRLFHNNGDGTFTDITRQSKVIDDRWTTSCAMADFNGDGFPDLYAVNYLTGKDLFSKPCRMSDGSTRLCTPHEFQSSHDQVWVNSGDGHFVDQSAAAGVELPEGKALGVVVASWDQSSRLSLFIANDSVPNFYFHNDTPSRGAALHFKEIALYSGLAVDAEGQPQACMGVACGDPNGDGLLDVFVTNFRNESNTLYLQQADTLFVDATRQTGLREPSFPMLGFGTQFLDADLDGWEDLAVANGHVGNLEHHGIPYEMPPQFFRNIGDGRFVELKSDTAGPYFGGKYLGRGMARVDWNRDGRDDFAVTHLKRPAALLTNQTSAVGHYLFLELRGTESDRDAVGSIVTVTCGRKKFVRHLTAGDGYQASNQKQLRFGLGTIDQIDRVDVQWPTGKIQTFLSPAVNSSVLSIEGQKDLIPLAQ